MKHEVELELKTLVTKEQFYQLLAFYQPIEFVEQHNYYYVTNDLSHYAFRIRVKGDEKLFTLKQHTENGIVEHEKLFTGEFYEDEEIRRVLTDFNLLPPYHMFGELITERAMYIDEFAELCFDINHYNGLIDYEIEYEVKKPHDYLARFQTILAKAQVEYVSSWASKYRRCLSTIDEKKED